MPCSVSWHLPFLLFISIPIARADWNFDPQAANNIPSPQPSVLATNNELPENLILDPTVTGVKRVEDTSDTGSDQSQENTLSNGFELASDQTDAMIPEGPLMAEGESCLPNNGRSSRKMRARRDQGICEWNPLSSFKRKAYSHQILSNRTNRKGRSPGQRSLQEVGRSGERLLQLFVWPRKMSQWPSGGFLKKIGRSPIRVGAKHLTLTFQYAPSF